MKKENHTQTYIISDIDLHRVAHRHESCHTHISPKTIVAVTMAGTCV